MRHCEVEVSFNHLDQKALQAAHFYIYHSALVHDNALQFAIILSDRIGLLNGKLFALHQIPTVSELKIMVSQCTFDLIS